VSTAPHEPSRACYLRGCREDGCVDANRRYCKHYRVTSHANGPRRVDASPYAAIARRYAAAGWSHSEMAAFTGCCDTVFHELLHGVDRIGPVTAARLDRIPARPERMGKAAYVDATGTQRRAQALHRHGYTVDAIADALHIHADHLSRILHKRHARVLSSTAASMKAVYADWSGTRGPSELSEQRASALGWRDPQWWEDLGDLDDPGFDPAKAETVLNFRETAALRREEIIHFAWHGDTPEQILARLNNEVSISTVRQIVAEWRTGEKRNRAKEAA
jgi:hypothetical protein